jgi:hypothetical protein
MSGYIPPDLVSAFLSFGLLCCVLGGISGALGVLAVQGVRARLESSARALSSGKWEAIQDHAGAMWRVRWSIGKTEGVFLYVRHFSGPLAEHYARVSAKALNEEGRRPW